MPKNTKLPATTHSYSTTIVKIAVSVILSQKFVSTGSMPSKRSITSAKR